MNNKTSSIMITSVLIGIVILLLLNMLPSLWSSPMSKYIDRNSVRGMAVFYRDQQYTLNFSQQNEMINLLNAARFVGPYPSSSHSPDVEKIVIYQFDAADLVLIPIAYNQNDLLFKAPWNPEGLLRDTSNGALKALLSTTYDN